MASNNHRPPDDPCNTETDEETAALRKKRSRRVSFAEREITSVHIFKRDEDYETPPDDQRSSESAKEADDEVLGFFRDLADSDDSIEEGDAEDDEVEVASSRKSFLRPIESPSPGSSIIGSATSNDEENFFGPVSANFISPGRLYDSAASDDNHDITMDSTAFSMHYRSLMGSESGGDLKTPTTVSPAVEDNVTTPSGSSSLMALTNGKKQIPQFPLPIEKISGDRDSNNMTLLGKNSHSYDYAKLSPTLEALLAEGNKELCSVSVPDPTDIESFKSEVSMFGEDGSGSIVQMDNGDGKRSSSILEKSSEGEFTVCNKSDQVHGVSPHATADQIATDFLPSTILGAGASVDHQLHSPYRLNKVQFPAQPSQDKTLNQLSQVNTDGKASAGKMALDDKVLYLASDTSPNKGAEVVKLDSYLNQESRQHPTDNWLKEIFPKDRRNDFSMVMDSDKQQGSPLGGSISSLSGKQKQIFVDAASSQSQLSYATPSTKEPGSFLSGVVSSGSEVASSICQRNSVLQVFQPSPLASSLKDGIERSKQRLSKLLSSATSPVNAVMEQNSKDNKGMNVDAMIINLEKHLFSVDLDNISQASSSYKDGNGTSTIGNSESLSKNNGIIGHVTEGASLVHISSDANSKESALQLMTKVAALSQTTWLQKEAQQQQLLPSKSVEEQFVIPGSSSSPVEIHMNDRCDDTRAASAHERVSNSVQQLGQKPSSSMKHCSSLSYDPKHEVQNEEPFTVVSGQEGNHGCNIRSTSYSTTLSDKVDASFAERGAESQSLLTELNHFRDSTLGQIKNDAQSCCPSIQKVSNTLAGFHSPLSEKNARSFQSVSVERNAHFEMQPTLFQEEVAAKGTCRSPLVKDHGSFRHRLSPKEKPPRKELVKGTILKELSQSPSRDKLWQANNGNVQSVVEEHIIFGNSNYYENCIDGSHLGLQEAQSQFPLPNLKNISGQKRRKDKSFIGNPEHANKISRIEGRPFHKSQGSDLELILACSHGGDVGKEMVGHDPAIKVWNDILLKFSTDTKVLLPPLADKLDRRVICILQDILVDLQKVKVHQILCSQIQPQETCDESGEVRQKRVTETRLLLYKLVYEKARLQLMYIKRDKLLKRSQQLSSAMQESRMLKSDLIQSIHMPVERKTPVDDDTQTNRVVKLCSKEVSSKKAVMMRNDLQVIEKKIKNLTKSACSYSKMKELSRGETVILLNDHLKKRTTCQLIRDDLQLWEIDDFGSSGGQHNIVLNYQGLFWQRFKINPVHTAGVHILIEVNDVCIMKTFPSMDASVAFAFTLNAEFTKKDVGISSLAWQTQIVSSRLQNLLDVVEELQLAQIECRNLVQTSFSSPTVEQLDLQLCFIDFKSGGKVTMALDMTCLNCGVYPSEIVPYKVQTSIAISHKALPETLLAEIRDALDGLVVGYSRILRLCKCISDVVHS